jgi:hypothetical protein
VQFNLVQVIAFSLSPFCCFVPGAGKAKVKAKCWPAPHGLRWGIRKKQMRFLALLTIVLLSLTHSCIAAAYRQKKQHSLVIDISNFSERYDLPLQKLAEAVQSHPKTYLFRVTGTLMFGGWQRYTFWYDRQNQKLRYSYADGGETYTGEKQSVWAGETAGDLDKLAKQTTNVTSESFFKTLPQLGCRQVYYHYHQP